MHSFHKYASILIILFTAHFTASAVNPANVRFNNEATDTTHITDILIKASQIKDSSPSGRIGYIARCFLDKPYKAGTLEGAEGEKLTVNMDEFDCTTFVETVLAMEMTLRERRSSWQDFLYNLERIRYRGGRLDGYASRLHYISEWIVDNTHRGIVSEVTERVGNASSQVKTLDFMSTNRDKYPAMKDDDTFNKIKNMEVGFRSHRIPYIKTQSIGGANLREGDMVAITTNLKNLDVTHVGFVTMVNGVPHLLHASSSAGKVTIDSTPLQEYVKRGRKNTGIKVIRLQ